MTQLLTFSLGDRKFGLRVGLVQEVLQAQPVTPVPLADEVVCGLVNLRGQIVTAVDLRGCLQLHRGAATGSPVNVIVRTEGEPISLLADRVGDVVEVDDDDFASPPESTSDLAIELIRGAYKLKSGLLLLVDLEAVIARVTSLHNPPLESRL